MKPTIPFLWLLLLHAMFAKAQCTDWKAQINFVNASTCFANGSFGAGVSGPDAGNLSNIMYGIPVAGNSYAVPLNTSSLFTNVPPGSYTVSAVAACNGTYVGRNTTVSIASSYAAPVLNLNLQRASINCGAYGTIGVDIQNGRAPFQIKITSAPSAYLGPINFTAPNASYAIGNLPVGSYTIQVTDACASGTAPQTITVNSLSLTSIPLEFPLPLNNTCNSIIIPKPYILNAAGWFGYYADPSFRMSVQVSGGVVNASTTVPMDAGVFTLPLLPGKTIKDCYGKTITYTITPPCGSPIVMTRTIPYPTISHNISQTCSTFVAYISIAGISCKPFNYTITDLNTSFVYGPYTNPTAFISSPTLPYGSYRLNYTTADGYSNSYNFSASPVSGTPYSVTVVNGSSGFTNYIEGFSFYTTASFSSKIVELFSGPAGYSFQGAWTSNNNFRVYYNQTPTAPGTQRFPAGNYVWKVTDNCGTYYLPVTVGPQDLYQFAAGISQQKLTCQGLWIWPSGTATNNGQSRPWKFSLLLNGYTYPTPPNGQWPQYNAGDSVLLTQPGIYTILPSSNTYTYYFGGPTGAGSYPNPYSNTYAFTNTQVPVQPDMSQTQGFACAGGTSAAQIYIKGMGGIPYKNPARYNYYLAQAGNGASGPYIASNSTGVFTSFGGIVNATYDVKIVDSCGAFSVQPLKILNLQTARLINTSKYILCNNDSIRLSAIYLPGATYSWTGPAGFTSALREPVLKNVTAANTGVYRVTITTTSCPQSVTDTTILYVAPNPPKPNISLDCGTMPVTITVTNPSAAYKYKWGIGRFISNMYFYIQQSSDYGYTKEVDWEGSFRALAIDTITGCSTASDSIMFADDPNIPLVASIYSPHLKICTGDTTILVAQGPASSLKALSYQWFKNGAVIPGATGVSFITWQPGNYKVRIQTGPCSIDTSDEVTVTVVANPVASISAAKLDICSGETTPMQANTGAGYSYTWLVNGTSIPGATGSNINAGQSGTYVAIVSNGGCIATSNALVLNVHPAPLINLVPGTDQYLCSGNTINFTTPYDTAYSYTWFKNGSIVPGANANSYLTSVPGKYKVRVSNKYCPDNTSQEVAVSLLPTSVYLNKDTIICDTNFALPMGVPNGFDDVLWSTGATTQNITATAGGTYWVRVSNKCGVYTDTMVIRTLKDYLPNLPADTIICNEQNMAIIHAATLSDSVQWSTGDTGRYVTISRPGKYWLSAKSPCGIFTDTVNIIFCAPEIKNMQPTRDSICEGDCINFTTEIINYPQTYKWRFEGGSPAMSDSANPGTICYTQAGIYKVSLDVSNTGGSSSYSSTVTVLSKPKPRFKDTTITVSYKTSLGMPACANAQVAEWYKDGKLLCANCPVLEIEARDYRSVYHCVVRNGDCPDSCTYKLQVIDIPHDVWLPDVFSPNGDGRNDLFRMITDNPNVLLVNLSVYNRFGQRVFMGTANGEGWDGTFGGQHLDLGTYFWTIRYRVLGNDELYFKKGEVTLIK